MAGLKTNSQIKETRNEGFGTARDAKRLWWPVLVILPLAGVLDVIVAASNYSTYDEGEHISYGRQILQQHPDRYWLYSDSKTPISALNALPGVISEHIDAQKHPRLASVFRVWRLARLPSIASLLSLDFLIYLWAYELYGTTAGLCALLLAVLSPNLIAHGSLATTDGYFATGVLLALFFLRRYLRQPSLRNAALSGLALSLAQLAKPLAIYLYVIAVLFVIALAVKNRGKSIKERFGGIAFYAAAALVSFTMVMNLAYCFDRPFRRLSSYNFESSTFNRLQATVVLRALPIPVPYPFLQGLDMMKAREANGATYGNVYLLGTLRSVSDPQFHGFKSYYAVALFFKEPIPLQLLFMLGLIWIYRNRTGAKFFECEFPLLAAGAFLFAWLSLFSKAQVGIRHILPVLAIETIIAGAAFSGFTQFTKRRKLMLAGLVGWLAVSTFSYYPDLIPYTNEWVGDRKLTYRIVADSNVDWGQNQDRVDRFLKQNPSVKLNPDHFVSGMVLVNVNRLVGVWPRDKEPLFWLQQYRPIGHVGYAHLLYQVPAQASK
jgi:4-amino-4-deoxy-L-arabinose transferase-like glycosyltransferase